MNSTGDGTGRARIDTDELAMSIARRLAGRGHAACEARQWAFEAAGGSALNPGDGAFWATVADEMDSLEAAAEARSRWRVIDGGAGRPNPLTRRFVIADKRAESPLALVPVAAGQQRRYRMPRSAR